MNYTPQEKMKIRNILRYLLIVLIIGGTIGFFAWKFFDKKNENPVQTVQVTKGTIIDKIMAVGTLEPEEEVLVKSQLPGTVSRIFHKTGDFVQAGEPLLEIKPNPTPLETAPIIQEIESLKADLEILRRDRDRIAGLQKKGYATAQEFENAQRQVVNSELKLNAAQERLTLLKEGRLTVNKTTFESIIRAQVSGFIIDKTVNTGDPVVPATSFQPGNTLMTIADMKRLIFKGTVDEVNVGKLSYGLPVEFTIGAIPGKTITGTLRKIGLKAKKKDNSATFDVEIEINPHPGIELRAGYSANANIIAQKKENVLTLPERVIITKAGKTYVLIPDSTKTNGSREYPVQTGLSDAITIEIASGLQEKQIVMEPPLKVIE
jgi:HlyD family secretion protein